MNLRTAFELVENPCDWRAPIAKFVTIETLGHAGVTIEDVKEAVAFYTATEATVEFSPFAKAGAGYVVTAKGYRAGPAGP